MVIDVKGTLIMASFQKYVEKLLDWFIALAVMVIVVVVTLQVASRYLFSSPYDWTEEIARLLFVWIAFLGGYIALKTNSHISVETFVKRFFSEESRKRIANVLTFFLVYFLGYLTCVGIGVVWETRGSTTPVMEFSFLYFHIAIPLIALMMTLLLVARIFRMGWRDIVLSACVSLAIAAVIYLIFGINTFSGRTLVIVALVTMALLILFGMPIAFSMGIACTAFLLLAKGIPSVVMHTRMIGGIDSFTLLAVPFFVLAGDLLNTGGITVRLVTLAKVLVGHIRGGLGMVVVVGEYFFSGISGSTVADVSAIGALLIPAMKRAGYSSEVAVSVISAATAMGNLVPPCILMVVLGGMTGLSVGALFAAGFIPAVVLALCIMALIYVQAVRAKIAVEPRPTLKEAVSAVTGAIIPLLCPVIIFGGILSGAATPTEISVIAVIYAFIVGVFVYREIQWNQIIPILLNTARTTGTVMLLVGTASVLSWIFTTNQVPQQVARLTNHLSTSPMVFLVLANVTFILLGAILEGMPAMLILIPIFMPISAQLGIDPLHFGILAIASIGIGLFIPPIGMGIFIACTFAEIDVGKVFLTFLPYVVVLFIGLMIVSYFPWLTLVIPNMFFK
jgi:C4-dicarboxylate transporter, DctM subunit